MVKVQEITITGPNRVKGSNMSSWNVDLDGKPFGQAWTFTKRGEIHRYHAKTLSGSYYNFATLDQALNYLRGLM